MQKNSHGPKVRLKLVNAGDLLRTPSAQPNVWPPIAHQIQSKCLRKWAVAAACSP